MGVKCHVAACDCEGCGEARQRAFWQGVTARAAMEAP
jgi:hypothetical protein